MLSSSVILSLGCLGATMGQSDVAAQLSFSNNDANDCGKFGRTEAHQDSEDDRTFLPRVDPLERIFDIKNRKERPFVTICGPMVRYSKLPFRALVRDYETDLCYTPMTLAKEFVNSQVARDSEYTTNESDAPVILQFAARTAIDLGNATEIAAPFIDGVDLNCGCPQRWAISEGVGAHLMSRPELVAEMVREAKSRSVKRQNGGPLRVSIKIRVHDDLRRTVDFVRQAEMAGVDWITVHGRTRRQKSIEPVNVDAIALVSWAFADDHLDTLPMRTPMIRPNRLFLFPYFSTDLFFRSRTQKKWLLEQELTE